MSDETHLNTTLGELFEMREKLNRALTEKLGKEAESYFDIEMNSLFDRKVTFCSAFPDFGPESFAVVGSMDFHGTPQEAFDYAMDKIQNLKVPNNEEKINYLKKQIEKLENEN